jgi:N-acetylneuraminic acid mutarotase
MSAGGAGNAGSGGEAGAPDEGSPLDGTATEMALPDLEDVRQEHSVVAAAGEVYMIGGYTPNVTDSLEAYDPATETWRQATPFPEPMNHGNAGVIDEKIHVAGYYINGMTEATPNHYVYDPMTEEWTDAAPLPEGTERGAGCVAIDGELMYVVGGANAGMSVEFASRYDSSADAWEVLPPLPERREHCVAGFIGGIVYVAGGRADTITGIQTTTWAFDPDAMTWSEKADLDPPRGGLAGAVLGGQFIVFGGEGNANAQSGVFPDVNAYDPVTDSWESLKQMDVPRHGFGAAVLDGRIYLAGGATRQGGGADSQSSVYFFE